MKTTNLKNLIFHSLTIAAFAILCGCGEKPETTGTTPPISAKEAKTIAREAYVYGFPIVMNYKTIYNYVIDKEGPEYRGPFNKLTCTARLFTPEDKAIVTPNADTPYCMFWMDLRAEPMVLSVPEMETERFYHFQLIDLYTHNFAYVGTLTTGNGPGKFLIVGPGWDGEKPAGVTAVIHSETNFVFNVTRTQLFGPDDLPKVKQIQGSYGLQPLSTFLGTEAPSAKPLPELPKWVEGSQFDEQFFGYLDFMMALLEKPGEGEQALWENLARLGIGTDDDFDFASLSPEIQDALKAGVSEGFGEMEEFLEAHASDPLASGKIFGTRDFLTESARTNYQLEEPSMLRSVAAHMGLYGNSAAEAIYPTYLTDADKQPLDASKTSYTVTFEKEQLPPVDSFWSLTMYDGETQLFIDNPLDRYLLNSSMMEQFKREDDGSLVLHVAKDSPGDAFGSNWLPAPDGPFYMVLRLYGPKPEALEGKWTPPPARKAASTAAATPAPTTGTDAEIENLVRRTYPYIAMYNVINKGAMMEQNPFKTGWNGVFAMDRLADHTVKLIARPNNDTLYVTTNIDVRDDAVVIKFPAFDSKFVCLEVSAYDHYCAVPLATTQGDFEKPATVLFHSARTKDYSGGPVDGVDLIVELSGDFATPFLRVMPHASEPERLKKNLAAMNEVTVQTLAEFRGKPKKPVTEIEFPAFSTDEEIFENNFLEVMQFVVNHTTFDPDDEMDQAVLAALKPVGVELGRKFAPAIAGIVDGGKLAAAARKVHADVLTIWSNPEGNPYAFDLFKPKGEMTLEPMTIQSAYGPIGLPAHQAVYPGIGTADGKPMNAQNDYVLCMTKDELPPAQAFWSVTLYDSANGFFIPNESKKYSVGENAGFQLDKKGGIEIHIAAELPDGVPAENWLPINREDEGLDVVMRVYHPDLEKMKSWETPKAEARAMTPDEPQ